MMAFKQKIRGYKANEDGQFAVITAIIAVPLLMATSAAIDYTNAMREHKSIKDALDNAVLSAATNNRISDSERVTLAKFHFDQNYTGRANIVTEGTSENGRVDLWANGLLPYSVSDALGLSGVKLYAKSAAQRSEKEVICVLALSKSLKDSIKIKGNVEFFAPTCSVHSNSESSTAINSDSSKTPLAKSFCATGGVKGPFSPYAKGDCLPVEDPYLNVELPEIGPCVPEYKFKKGKNDDDDDDDDDDGGLIGGALGLVGDIIEESLNLTGSNSTFYPGTYCGGLTVDGINVNFKPGDYIMLDGALTFKNGAEADAEDVTFAFSGDKALLNIQSGSNVRVKAPSDGPRKGLAFMGMASPSEKLKILEKNKEGDQNKIEGGASLEVLGTVYFPTKTLKVKGEDTQMGAKAPATSFIAQKIELDGKSGARVQVNVDHRAADLPPIEPRAEDGAVLVE
ncbi:putative Flp pilus-assembly TadE/G-like protein [Litorimonas taeanensis]|uniref:Putative Flp pilus-assembly TadE/G-like protein n=1 Tax=Litorimonas taeanensis TaxID=568099 RepID=A0A420WL77_9PROT|nr:TadE/TadG family type IV pilus assembly protein [Litorimonas taeanensis]RKQ71801.1 putative Flp pilus-assembly TadE/G-like protein [Litorimonas taeanensis]